jgi:hypothetical protein
MATSTESNLPSRLYWCARLVPIEATDRRARGMAVLNNNTHVVAVQIEIVRLLDLVCVENPQDLVEAMLGIVELRLHIITREHETHKLAGFDLRA